MKNLDKLESLIERTWLYKLCERLVDWIFGK